MLGAVRNRTPGSQGGQGGGSACRPALLPPDPRKSWLWGGGCCFHVQVGVSDTVKGMSFAC